MKKEEIEKILHKKVKDGEKVSPVLPEGIKNYLIDIDGTITEDIPNEGEEIISAKPASAFYAYVTKVK